MCYSLDLDTVDSCSCNLGQLVDSRSIESNLDYSNQSVVGLHSKEFGNYFDNCYFRLL